MGCVQSSTPSRVLPRAPIATPSAPGGTIGSGAVASVSSISQSPPVAITSPLEAMQPDSSVDLAAAGKAFVKAIKAGDLSRAAELLDLKGDQLLERRSMWENTPLILACHYGHEDLALMLLKRGADPSCKNEQGCTALLYACVERMPLVTLDLIRQAIGPEALAPPAASVYSRHTDETSLRTPLCAAAENGFIDGVKALLSARVTAEPEAFTMAAARGHAEICSLLLPALREGEASELKARAMHAALIAAIAHGHEGAIAVLCADSEVVTAANNLEAAGSAVRRACELRGPDAPASGDGSGVRERILKLLLDHGLSADPVDSTTGNCALHIAASRGLSNSVALMLAAGANASATNERGEQAADLAEAAAHSELAVALRAAATRS